MGTSPEPEPSCGSLLGVGYSEWSGGGKVAGRGRVDGDSGGRSSGGIGFKMSKEVVQFL